MLLADGDVKVGANGSLTATTVTHTTPTVTETKGAFTITKDNSATASGTIILRADQNADDVNADNKAATVTLENTAANISGLTVKAYYNDEISGDVNGTAVTDIGITKTEVTQFTKKDYTKGYGKTLTDKIATTVKKYENADGAVDTTATADTKNWNDGDGFKPIGKNLANAFQGVFSGNGGTASYKINDLVFRFGYDGDYRNRHRPPPTSSCTTSATSPWTPTMRVTTIRTTVSPAPGKRPPSTATTSPL